eukprot:3261570-Pleurochrysis_carterae.AAC.1
MVNLQTVGGMPARKGLDEALKALGLRWAPLTGGADGSAHDDSDEDEETQPGLEEDWALGGGGGGAEA